MGVSVKQYNGGLAFAHTANKQSVIDGMGPSVAKFIEDFIGTPFLSADNLAGWTTTLVEGGASETTVALTDAAGGHLLITTDAAENDGANLQVTNEAFKLASGKPCYFGCKLKVSEATQSDILVGLCITDTDLLGGMTDGAYFRKVDGSTAMSFVLEKDSTETTGAVHTVVADTFVTLEFFFDGTNIDAYVDGVLQTRLAITNLPDDEELTPSIHYLAGSVNAKTCTVDWIRAIQFN